MHNGCYKPLNGAGVLNSSCSKTLAYFDGQLWIGLLLQLTRQ
jgi:hypothetical protein